MAEMWLCYDSDKQSMQFPVLPEKVTIQMPSKDEKVYVYGKGGTLLSKMPDAKVIKFSSFFPKKPCQGSIKNPISPADGASFLSAVAHLTVPARFIYCGGGGTSHAFPCRISYELYEQGGDPGSVYFNITVTKVISTQYRKIKMKTTSLTNTQTKTTAKTTATTEGRTSTKVQPKTYTVVKGDCLWNIAKKYYGNGARYTDIIAANKNIFSGKRANSTVIYVGDVLVIP